MKKTKKIARTAEPITVELKATETVKEAQRLMDEAQLRGEVFTAQAALQRANRTLEIIDLILADKKLEAIKLLREPYDIRVSVVRWEKADGK